MDSTTRIKDMPDYRGSTGLLAMDSKLYGTGRLSVERLKQMMGGGPSGTEYEPGTGIDIDTETHEISIDTDVVATKQDLNAKQDELEFVYDGNEKIVSIDGHAVGGTDITVDTELDPTSNNPVANSTLYNIIGNVETLLDAL